VTKPPVTPVHAGDAAPASSLEHGAAEVARLVLLLDPYGTGDWASGTAALMDAVAALPPEEAYSLLACSVLMLALETPVPRLPVPNDSGDGVDVPCVFCGRPAAGCPSDGELCCDDCNHSGQAATGWDGSTRTTASDGAERAGSGP